MTAARLWATATAALSALASPVGAQAYRARLDVGAQSVAYRGVTLDSVPVGDTLAGAGCGPVSPDGFAVTCLGADPYCTFFRPGPERQAGPVTGVADISVWGFGVPGLRMRASARVSGDLGDAKIWPGTDPEFELLEGYAEYAGPRLTARAGRITVFSRLGVAALDGSSVALRLAGRALELDVYAGWGLGRGAVLPITSSVLNPLDEYRPGKREIVVGGGVRWSDRWVDLGASYRREVDQRSEYFVSERFGLSGALRPVAGLSLTFGADYDLAQAVWGSGEATLAYRHHVFDAAAGVRRYRPHFELWTIWGAFSPVPYRSVHGRLAVRVTPWLTLRTQGERYSFDDTETDTPLADAETDGWRWMWGGTVTVWEGLTFDAGYHVEFGAGAASRGIGASASYAPRPEIRVTAHGSTLERPLEFRYSTADLTILGIELEGRVRRRARMALGLARYADSRERPDAGSFDWNQVRLTARVSVEFGRGTETTAPAVINRLPSGRVAR